MTFAATSKLMVQPLLQFVRALDAGSVAIYATASVGDGPPARIKLLDKPLQSPIGSKVNVPRLLRAVLLSAGVAAAASLLVAAYLGGSLQSEQEELQRRISQRRAALRLDPNADGSGLGLLAKRKQTTPSSVMVLEAISRALPDTTYVTELRIEGDKVQVVGMTQDAPSLDPPDGAVAAVHPRHVFRADHARGRTSRASVSISKPISQLILDPARECIRSIKKSHHHVADPGGGDLCRPCGRAVVHRCDFDRRHRRPARRGGGVVGHAGTTRGP